MTQAEFYFLCFILIFTFTFLVGDVTRVGGADMKGLGSEYDWGL